MTDSSLFLHIYYSVDEEDLIEEIKNFRAKWLEFKVFECLGKFSFET